MYFGDNHSFKICSLPQNLKGVPISSTQLVQNGFNKYEIIINFACGKFPELNKYEEFTVICYHEEQLLQANCMYPGACGYRNGIYNLKCRCNPYSINTDSKSGWWEFVIPYGDFGFGDKHDKYSSDDGCWGEDYSITFKLGENSWRLEHLYAYDCGYVTRRIEIEQYATIRATSVRHVLLSVSANELTIEQAEKQASQICNLLSLALGNWVHWSTMHSRHEEKILFVKTSQRNISCQCNYAPLRQHGNQGRIRKFIEQAYPVYLQDEDWWIRTIYWFAQQRNASLGMDAAMLLACMLLERAANKTLGISYSSHNKGSYMERVDAAFVKYGIESPAMQINKQRNALLHEGNLDLKEGTDECSAWEQLSDKIVELLLRMLNYKGTFNQNVSNWHWVNLSIAFTVYLHLSLVVIPPITA